MKKVVIKEIDGYNYTLVNNNKEYVKNIEFYDTYKPVVGDIIYISDNILNETNLYSFGEIYDPKNYSNGDIIKVISKDKEYYFQRRFG
jgi:hypothetical protein